MKNIFLITLATLVVTITISIISCCKPPEPEPIPKKVMLPSEIIFNSQEASFKGYVIKFTYDNKNRIIQACRLFNNTPEMPYDSVVGDYIYNSSGDLITNVIKIIKSGRVDDIQKDHYTYSKNFVTLEHEFVKNDTTLPPFRFYQNKYELQNGKMIKIYLYKNGDWQEYKVFSRDEKGNIVKISYLIENKSEIITYGEKRGVFSGINKPDWLGFWYFIDQVSFQGAINNPVKIESVTDNTNSSTIYEYLSYNSNDYPTKIKVEDLYEIEIKYIDAK